MPNPSPIQELDIYLFRYLFNFDYQSPVSLHFVKYNRHNDHYSRFCHPSNPSRFSSKSSENIEDLASFVGVAHLPDLQPSRSHRGFVI
jgi:hypothetical protein